MALFFLSAVWLVTPAVLAQTELQDIEPLAEVEEVLAEPTELPDSLDDQLLDLAKTYRGQLTEYQQAEKQYELAIAQYQQLNTLAALETAVNATQQLLLVRDQVLITYLRQVRIYLIDTEGINIDVKNRTIDRLDILLELLTQHIRQVERVEDRLQVQEALFEFELFREEYLSATIYAKRLIQFGRLRTANDQTEEVFQVVQAIDVSDLSNLRQQQRTRSLQETERHMEKVNMLFQELFLEIEENELKPQRDTGVDRGALEELYAEVAQTHAFLDELIRLSTAE